MSRHAQCDLFAEHLLGVTVVPCKPEMAWNYPTGGPFGSMSVTPSLDASASGHWHGHITAGEIK